MEWDEETCIKLISGYRNREILWNPQNPSFYNKRRKEDAWREVAGTIGRDVNEVKKKMESLKGSYRREKTRVRRGVGMGRGRNKDYTSNWFGFEHLHFLEDKNEIRRTSNEDIKPQISIQAPPTKKQKTNALTPEKQSAETDDKIDITDQSEWEVIGKSIGYQLKGLEETQLAIAQKLISDVIFYGKMNQLMPNSCINISTLTSRHLSSSSNSFIPIPIPTRASTSSIASPSLTASYPMQISSKPHSTPTSVPSPSTVE